jgi:hypothetical protein
VEELHNKIGAYHLAVNGGLKLHDATGETKTAQGAGTKRRGRPPLNASGTGTAGIAHNEAVGGNPATPGVPAGSAQASPSASTSAVPAVSASAPLPHPPQGTPAVTVDQAIKALGAVNKSNGNNEASMAICRAILAQFGAAKMSEVKPESYAAFVAACQAQTKAA